MARVGNSFWPKGSKFCGFSNTEGITELLPEQSAPQEVRPLAPSSDGLDCTPSAGAVSTDSPTQGSGSVPGTSLPATSAAQEPAAPAVHPMPAFLAAPPQHRPPKLTERPRTFSIRQAMDSLGDRLVIGGLPKPGNKDDAGSDQPEKEKPRPKLKL